MEPTSEQELKQLLDEGRITEQEYQELLEAIRQKEITQQPVVKPHESKPPTRFGKVALILMIMSIALPILSVLAGFLLAALGIKIFFALPLIPIALICALLAFIFGIVGWKTASGKIAAIGVPCMGLLILPGLALLGLIGGLFSHEVRAKEAMAHKQAAIAEVRNRHSENYKTYPMDTLEGLMSQGMAEIDKEIYVNGGGSLRIVSDSSEKRTIRLYEVPPWDVESSILTYQAKLKTLNLKGKAYLEMWCDIPGKGEFFSRGLEQPISGTTDWTRTKIPFRLEAGQIPENIKLNLVVEGIGTIWIDDIVLSSNPLN